jgi:hypothetical protein
MLKRQEWIALLAKWVTPMEAIAGAKSLAGFLPALAHYPDAAFTAASVRDVCLSGRMLYDGKFGPLTRVPTLGELDLALGRWWYNERRRLGLVRDEDAHAPVEDMIRIAPPPVDAWAQERAEQHVRALVEAFIQERAAMSKEERIRQPPKPGALRTDLLIATYEQAVKHNPQDSAAAFRLNMLRQQAAG